MTTKKNIKVVNTRDLVKQTGLNIGVDFETCVKVVNAFLAIVAKEIVETPEPQFEVRLKYLGTIKARPTEPYIKNLYNLQTKQVEEVLVPSYRKLTFTASENLRDNLKKINKELD